MLGSTGLVTASSLYGVPSPCTTHTHCPVHRTDPKGSVPCRVRVAARLAVGVLLVGPVAGIVASASSKSCPLLPPYPAIPSKSGALFSTIV